jgi:hypothetical protein
MAFLPALESSSCLPGVLFGSQAFSVMRWMAPETILEEVASQCLYLTDKPSHVGGRYGRASLPSALTYGS